MQSRVDETLQFKCQEANGHEKEVHTDDLLFVEISVSNELGKIKLSDIPVHVNINNTTFEILSVIVYVPNHFKPIVFFKNRLIELDDLIGRPVLRRKNLNVVPQLLIYKRKQI